MKLKSTIKNLYTGILYQIINIAFNFLVTPIIINNFGSSINGLIQTIRAVVNYVSFVGAGIAESAVVSLYKPLNEKNHTKISSIINACGFVFFKAGNIYSIFAIVIALVFPFILETEFSYLNSVILIFILFLFGASEFYVVGKYRALLTADQKLYVVNIVQSLGLLLSLLISYIMIYFKADIILLQLALSLAYISRIILLIIYISKRYTYLDSGVSKDFKSLNHRKSVSIHQLSGIITFGSQIVIANIFLGAKEASVYAVYSLIFTGIGTLLGVFSSSLLAYFGNLIIVSSKELIIENYKYYESIFYTVVFSIYTVAVTMTIPFLNIYIEVNDANYYRPELVILFSLIGLLNSIRTPGATIINAKGHYKETQYKALIEMLICLIGQLILVNIMGIEGILIATILAYLYRTIDVIFYSNKIIENSVIPTVRLIGINSIVLIIGVMVANALFDVSSGNYFIWIFKSILLTLGALTIFIFLNYIVNLKMYNKLFRNFKR